jgi:uncharacterized protein (DUF433 family)
MPSTTYAAFRNALLVEQQVTCIYGGRPRELCPHIIGKPVIRGARVPVELVLRKLGAGMSAEAILVDHPRLTLEDIHAAQAFAADYLADEDIVYG